MSFEDVSILQEKKKTFYKKIMAQTENCRWNSVEKLLIEEEVGENPMSFNKRKCHSAHVNPSQNQTQYFYSLLSSVVDHPRKCIELARQRYFLASYISEVLSPQ